MIEYVVLLHKDGEVYVYIFYDIEEFTEFIELHKGEKMEIL
jgi:hypothetical protein